MKPIIGIVSRTLKRADGIKYNGCPEAIRRMVVLAGGTPLMILPTQKIDYIDTEGKDIPDLTDDDKEALISVINRCDGIILPGGRRSYEYDYFIASYLIEHDIPTLGICMGMQVLGMVDTNLWYGKGVLPNDSSHDQKDTYVHDVSIKHNTRLFNIIKKDSIRVNSSHSYHLIKTNKFQVSAMSNDIIEAIEKDDKRFMIGIQWHPEKLYEIDDDAKAIVDEFINCCKGNIN